MVDTWDTVRHFGKEGDFAMRGLAVLGIIVPAAILALSIIVGFGSAEPIYIILLVLDVLLLFPR